MSVIHDDCFAAYITKKDEYPDDGNVKMKVKWFLSSQTFINCIFALIALLVMLFITTILLQVCNYRRPQINSLPDSIHELLPYKNLILPTEIMMYVSAAFAALIMLLKPNLRTLQVLRRVIITYSIIMISRDITMPITNLPDPSERCKTFEKTSVSLSPKLMYKTLMKGVTCGDMIFSGHAVAFLMPVLVIGHFYQKFLWIPFFIVAVIGSILIIISRLHYSVDVILSWMICPMVFFIYNTIAEHPETYESSLPKIINIYYAHMEWNDPITNNEYSKQKDVTPENENQAENSVIEDSITSIEV